METLVCASVEEWLNRLADERESEGDITSLAEMETRQLGFQVGNRRTLIPLRLLRDPHGWWSSEEARDATWERLGVTQIMFCEMLRRPILRQLFYEMVARDAEPVYHCKSVGEWVRCLSHYFIQADTDTHYGCTDPGTHVTYLLGRNLARDMHSWFDTVKERDLLLSTRRMNLSDISDLLRFPEKRQTWFKGTVSL